MVRKATLTLMTVLAALAGLVILPHTASAVSLKQSSVVTGDIITLGDIFQGLPENNEKVLGIAPQPGQEIVLNARTLLRIAVALDLPWRPASSNDKVVLTRAASLVDRDMIESAIHAQLETEGMQGKYKIVIPDTAAKIVLSPDVAPALEITNFELKPDSGWFEASVAAPSADNPAYKGKITGTVKKLVDVPVLRETMKAGTIIGARDIDYVELEEKDLRPDMLVNANDLIGMTPRRLTMAGKPLKAIDIESPIIVQRGDIVTMMFQQGGLTLTASGKALQDGAKGDQIRVLNQISNKTIEGFVTASKEVTVETF